MIVIKNTQRSYHIDAPKLKKQVAIVLNAIGYPEYDLTLWFTTNATIRRYNRQFRGKDKETDVISFPYYETTTPGLLPKHSSEEPILGDIMLSPAYVVQHEHTWQETFEERILLLIVHSICHLVGYDHETDADDMRMQTEEQRLLRLLR